MSDKLLSDISRQKIDTTIEIHQIKGISTAGKARNIGAQRAKGEILIFIDDDISIGDDKALTKLIEPLIEDKSIGATFSALLIPSDSSSFQRSYADQIPRCEIPPVDKTTDAGAMSTHFCAIRKDVFFGVGRFNENLKRGEDPEFSFRAKGRELRLVQVANLICFHAVPNNLREVARLHFRNGVACAFTDKYYPHLNIDVDPQSILNPVGRQIRLFRVGRFVCTFFRSIFKGQFLLLLAKISYIAGYFLGWIKK
ncbi:MAG: glycosyltransferase [Candidatus Omnitrophota bacterium]